jgi:hypothetical protein
VTSATLGVIRPPSRGPFLIRGEERVLCDVRVEVCRPNGCLDWLCRLILPRVGVGGGFVESCQQIGPLHAHQIRQPLGAL